MERSSTRVAPADVERIQEAPEVPRVPCAECGIDVVVDPTGRCPEGHLVPMDAAGSGGTGTAGARGRGPGREPDSGPPPRAPDLLRELHSLHTGDPARARSASNRPRSSRSDTQRPAPAPAAADPPRPDPVPDAQPRQPFPADPADPSDPADPPEGPGGQDPPPTGPPSRPDAPPSHDFSEQLTELEAVMDAAPAPADDSDDPSPPPAGTAWTGTGTPGAVPDDDRTGEAVDGQTGHVAHDPAGRTSAPPPGGEADWFGPARTGSAAPGDAGVDAKEDTGPTDTTGGDAPQGRVTQPPPIPPPGAPGAPAPGHSPAAEPEQLWAQPPVAPAHDVLTPDEVPLDRPAEEPAFPTYTFDDADEPDTGSAGRDGTGPDVGDTRGDGARGGPSGVPRDGFTARGRPVGKPRRRRRRG